MKIIHCSDLHLDADLKTKYDAASAAERRAELLDTFRRLCRYAREENVSAVLICGDLFDTASPSPSAVRTVEDLILGNGEILFFYLRGNHDERPMLFRTRPRPDNLYLFRDDWTSWELSDGREQGLRVCIAGREPSNSVFTSPVLDPSCINIVMLHGAPCAAGASTTWPWAISITTALSRWMIGAAPLTAAVWKGEDSTSAAGADLS